MSSPSATEFQAPAQPDQPRPANKPPRQRPMPAQQPAQQPAKPRKIRRVATDRSYYVVQVGMTGEIESLILRLPTIGQARKARENAAKAARVPIERTKIARVVIVA